MDAGFKYQVRRPEAINHQTGQYIQGAISGTEPKGDAPGRERRRTGHGGLYLGRRRLGEIHGF